MATTIIPKSAKTKKTKECMIHTRVTPKLFEALRKRATVLDIPVSQLVRLALTEIADPATKVTVQASLGRAG